MTTNVALHHLPRWTLGDRLRKIRREAGLSQAQFAAQLGYQPQRYSHWESDRNSPADIIDVARRIRREFEVPEAWTLGLLDGPIGGGNEVTGEQLRIPGGKVTDFIPFPTQQIHSKARLLDYAA